MYKIVINNTATPLLISKRKTFMAINNDKDRGGKYVVDPSERDRTKRKRARAREPEYNSNDGNQKCVCDE